MLWQFFAGVLSILASSEVKCACKNCYVSLLRKALYSSASIREDFETHFYQKDVDFEVDLPEAEIGLF